MEAERPGECVCVCVRCGGFCCVTINCASEGTVKRVKDASGRWAMDEEGM